MTMLLDCYDLRYSTITIVYDKPTPPIHRRREQLKNIAREKVAKSRAKASLFVGSVFVCLGWGCWCVWWCVCVGLLVGTVFGRI
jgi:hypothetical protein